MKSSCGKIALCLTILLSFLRPSAAAEYSAGAKVGLNVASIFGDSVQNLSPRVGFNICLYATEWLNNRLGLQQEVAIGARGGRWNSDPTMTPATNSAYISYATDFTYLDIPLLVKWRFLNNDAIRPSLYAGPVLAFPLVAQADYQGNTKDMMVQTNKFDFDVTAGFSLDIRRGNLFVPIDIRYMLGLTNYAKGNGDIGYNAHVQHSVVSISAGLGFLLDFKKNKD